MWAAIITLAGSIFAGILIPLFAQWLKSYISKLASDAAAKQLAISLENIAAKNSIDQANTSAQINQEIQAQTQAKDEFVKDQARAK